MKRSQQQAVVVLAALVISVATAGVSLAAWFKHAPALKIDARMPGGDGTPPEAAEHRAARDLTGCLKQFDGVATDMPGAWPWFRGADRDNICKAIPPLAESWPESGPPVLWRIELGEGHAGAAVYAGRVYVLDYDEKQKADVTRCFALADGREIWRRSYVVNVKRNHGMSRTVPAVNGEYIVTLGPRCHVVCLDAKTGDFKWGIDLQKEYGTKEPLWYAGQCPIIENGIVILAPCGTSVLMMGVDCATGKPVWQTPNPHKWDMSHASIIPAAIAGKKMYVYSAIGGVVGVSAEPADAGAVLWEVPWAAKVVAPSPVPIDGDRIFLTAGYGEGGMTIKIAVAEGKFKAEVLEKHGPKDGLASEQQTPIFSGGLLYGIMPKDAGAARGQFVCYKPDGTRVWSSGESNRFGLGPFILADNKFFVLDDNGTLTMARVSGEKYEPLARAQVLKGQDAWGPIAVAGDRMLMRDSKQMVCIAVGAAKGANP
jgi:outer membrane protein assembly factor BamB